MGVEIPFRVYYSDGSTYDGPPENTPIFEVLVIVERSKEHGYRLVTNGDYYCWDNERKRWLPGDELHMIQYLHRPGWKRVLLGITVNNNEWNDVMKRATSDPDFPVKTGYDFHEVKP